MKKLICLLLTLAVVLGLCACGNGGQTGENVTDPPTTNAPTTLKRLKVLAIGNSFSVDAMEHLYAVAKAEGVEEIVLGNLFIGGCALNTHADNSRTNANVYRYYKNTTGQWEEAPQKVSLLYGLQDEQWDIITMQQASGYSGLTVSYQPHLNDLVAYVNENKTNPEAKLYWHMTWAYQRNSTHADFEYYRRDQDTMYIGIVGALQQVVEPSKAFEKILPVGTAIQNARTSHVGDALTRDGYHLSDLGRVIASYTWYAAINGQPLYAVNIDRAASAILSEQDRQMIVAAVNAAIANPYDDTRLK